MPRWVAPIKTLLAAEPLPLRWLVRFVPSLLSNDLQARGLLPLAQAVTIAATDQAQSFSLHYELRALLYLGITRLDLLALTFSIFTLRYYRSLLPPEIATVLAGMVRPVAAGALLRALRPARFGLTSLPDDEPRHFNLENLIQAQTAHTPGAPTTSGFEFGGGQTGGGGATGQF